MNMAILITPNNILIIELSLLQLLLHWELNGVRSISIVQLIFVLHTTTTSEIRLIEKEKKGFGKKLYLVQKMATSPSTVKQFKTCPEIIATTSWSKNCTLFWKKLDMKNSFFPFDLLTFLSQRV